MRTELAGIYPAARTWCISPALIFPPALSARGSALQWEWRWQHRQNRRVTYTNLLTSGKLYDCLREIDAQANGQLNALITQMARAEGATEQLKAENHMEWVQRM